MVGLVAMLHLFQPQAVRVADLYEDGSFTLMPATRAEVDGVCLSIPGVSVAVVRVGRWWGVVVSGRCA